MPAFAEENRVMWRGSVHVVSLMDVLRLRAAGWVTDSLDGPDLQLGVVHVTHEYDSPQDAARHLDTQAAQARQRREAGRPRQAGKEVRQRPDSHDRTQTERAHRATRRPRGRST
jgi:hypothetical protein